MSKTPRSYLRPKTKHAQGKKQPADRLKKKYRPHACEGCGNHTFTYHEHPCGDDSQQMARCRMCGREQTIDVATKEGDE